jgi:phage gp45-like
MTDSETLRFIRQEIQRQLNIVLFGQAKGADGESESIENLYPGMPTVEKRPVAHPYGLVSRAPDGTLSINVRTGDHVGNRTVIGHRDKDRPKPAAAGETILYSKGGYRIAVQNGQVMIGKGEDLEPLVVGDSLTSLLEDLLDLLAQHTHAAPGAPPTEAPQFLQMKTESVSGDKLLAKDGGRF